MAGLRTACAAFVCASTGCLSILVAPGSASANTATAQFLYNGGTEATWTVPAGVHYATLTVVGAGGGGYNPGLVGSANGGNGAVVTTKQRLTPGQRLGIRVGGSGDDVGAGVTSAGGSASAIVLGSAPLAVAGGGGSARCVGGGGPSDTTGGSGAAAGTAAGGNSYASLANSSGFGAPGTGNGGAGGGPGTGGAGGTLNTSAGSGVTTLNGAAGGGGGFGGVAANGWDGQWGGNFSNGSYLPGTDASFARATAAGMGGGGAGFGGGGAGGGGGGYGGGGGSGWCGGGAGGSYARPGQTASFTAGPLFRGLSLYGKGGARNASPQPFGSYAPATHGIVLISFLNQTARLQSLSAAGRPNAPKRLVRWTVNEGRVTGYRLIVRQAGNKRVAGKILLSRHVPRPAINLMKRQLLDLALRKNGFRGPVAKFKVSVRALSPAGSGPWRNVVLTVRR